MHAFRFALRLALVMLALVSSARSVAAAPVLTHLGAHPNTDASAVPGLGFATGIAVSPDGAYVYATSVEGTLLLFSRNAATGALAHVQTWFDDAGGIDGLGGAMDVAISPDGATVYTAGEAVAVFARDVVTGLVTLVEAESTAGVSPRRLAVSADGENVYVAGFDGLVTYSRDAVTGALTLIDSEAPEFRDLAVSPDGQNVYAVNPNHMITYARDPGTGALTAVQTFSQINQHSIDVAPDGVHVYVGYAGSSGQVVRVYTRAPGTGELVQTFEAVTGISGVTISPDGDFAVAADFDALHTYTRNATTGALTLAGSLVQGLDATGLGLTEAVAFTADGQDCYLAGDYAVTSVRLAAGTGVPTFVDADAGGIGVRNASTLATSGDGANVYAVGNDDAITTFDRDAGTGALALRQVIFDFVGAEGLGEGTGVVVSPDDAHVYVASGRGAVAVFGRDAGTGALTFVEVERDGVGGVDGIAGATSLVVSPDGDHLYVIGRLDVANNAIVTFARDAGTGVLTFVSALPSPASRLAISPDGAHVYGRSSTVNVFSRNPATGALTAIQTVDAVPTDFTRFDLLVSPDGGQIYLTTPGGVRAYARDGATGQLSLAQIVSGLDGTDELANSLRDLTISADGTLLVGTAVTGVGGPALVVFTRDPGTGTLGFRQAQLAGPNGGPTLDGLADLVLSPDGNHLYVTVFGHVSTFGFTSLCPPAPGAGCRAPGSSLLRLADKAADQRDSLTFRWLKGAATTIEDYDDPIAGGTRYALCLYDQTGLLLESHALPNDTSPKTTWRPIGPSATPRGLKYVRRESSPEGIKTMVLRPGSEGNASIVVRARGPLLAPPAPPFTAPVTVQLRSESGICWGVTYATGSVNGTNGLFVAKTQ